MRKAIFATATAIALASLAGCVSTGTGIGKTYEVSGVEEGDMLKLRAGPGVGYRVIAGLPNGTRLRIHSCQQIGSTNWCKAMLKGSSTFDGYVSWTYLRQI
jgi:uncharacterized protein YraI